MTEQSEIEQIRGLIGVGKLGITAERSLLALLRIVDQLRAELASSREVGLKMMQERCRLDDEIDRLSDELALVRGAMNADDKRLAAAGERVGIFAGCDTAEQMADELIEAKAELADERKGSRLAMVGYDERIAKLKATLAAVQIELDKHKHSLTGDIVREFAEKDAELAAAQSELRTANHIISVKADVIDGYVSELAAAQSELAAAMAANKDLQLWFDNVKADFDVVRAENESFMEIARNSNGVMGYHMNGEMATWEEVGIER